MGGYNSIWRPWLPETTEHIGFVLLPPCCFSHWISSNRKRERNGESQRWISTVCSCLPQCLHHFKCVFTICHCFCGILWKLEVRAPRYLKEATGQYPDIRRKREKSPTSYLHTIKINIGAWKEEGSVGCRWWQVFERVHTLYLVRGDFTSSNRTCKYCNDGKDPEILDPNPNIA